MTPTAIAVRGEASLRLKNAALLLRPTFAALVAAEEELGPLFALVERAARGELKLSEMAGLFWHCRHDAAADLTRENFSEALADAGLASATPALKILLGQILGGR
ncbi:MAG: gene transfer agent family protein [Sphingomonadaceae bacterium]|nr:gene transfer agent family protein [Sphingomonadaceae bacterium]